MTTKSLVDFITEVDLMITANDDELSYPARVAAVKRALMQYSQDLPDLKAADVTGDGGRYYDLTGGSAVISDWVDDFSRVEAIEYPANAVSDDENPIYLSASDWRQDYESGGVRYLYFPNHSPASTETVRVTYTVPYVFDSSNNVDIPQEHFYPICLLAACFVCRDIATRYSRTSDSIINADSVNHRSRQEMFNEQADKYCGLYSEALNVDAIGPDAEGAGEPGSSDFVDFDTKPGFPGTRRFIHHGEDIR